MINRIESIPNSSGTSNSDGRTRSEGQVKAIQEGKARIEAGVRNVFAAKGPGFVCIEIAKLRAQVGIRNPVEEKWFQEVLMALQTEGFQRSSTGESSCVHNKG